MPSISLKFINRALRKIKTPNKKNHESIVIKLYSGFVEENHIVEE